MDSKIRIKMGALEVEYEGNEQFINEKLIALLSDLSALIPKIGLSTPAPDPAATSTLGSAAPTKLDSQMTTSTVAAKLGCSSGPDLIVAALVRLTLSQTRSTFSRDEINNEMKLASAYYKQTYSKNLTKYLNNLVKAGKLVESAKDTYALSAPTRKDLEPKLAL